MASHASVSEIARHEGETVVLEGWLYNSRSRGKIAFLSLRDGTGIIQCVLRKDAVDEATFEAARRLGPPGAAERAAQAVLDMIDGQAPDAGSRPSLSEVRA